MQFRYKPPSSYVLKSIIGIIISIILLTVLNTSNDKFSFFLTLFFLANTFIYFLFNIILCFKIVDKTYLGISKEYFVLPRRWNKSIQIPFSKVIESPKYLEKEKVIEIIYENEVYIIEDKWMNSNDFIEVKKIFIS
jgi:hypothetical protein